MLFMYLRRFLRMLINPIRALFTSPKKVFSTGGRLFGISLPARVAVLVWFFLVIIAVIFFLLPQDAIPEAGEWEFWCIIILVMVIPLILYHVLKLWLEGDVSPFEDIEKAWNEGVMELERQDLDLSQIPLFLILGSDGQQREKALFDASGLSLNIRDFPQGPRPLHWYVNPDGIYLVATEAGSLSKLAHIAKSVAEEDQSSPAPSLEGPSGGPDIRGTIVPGGSLVSGSSGSVIQSGPVPVEPVGPPPGGPSEIRGTMQVLSGGSMMVSGAVDKGGGVAAKRPVTIPPEEGNLEERRLEYVCQLIRRARQPVCPVNGILALVPFGLIQRGPREGVELQKTLQRDLRTARRVFKLRCPATAAVIGMEKESGFRELVRRVGPDKAARQRFGKGFSLGNPPIPERLEALAAHACGSFEAFVYSLFREKGSLTKPGNTKLYSLLCKIRRHVQIRLGNILVAGFGADLDKQPDAEPLFFGGCYFAAVGESEDRQAFVKGILDKLPGEAGELQWTEEALAEDGKYRRWANLVIGFDVLLLLGVVAMIFFAS